MNDPTRQTTGIDAGEPLPLTPQQRLALSRLALAQALHPRANLQPDAELQKLLQMDRMQKAQKAAAVQAQLLLASRAQTAEEAKDQPEDQPPGAAARLPAEADSAPSEAMAMGAVRQSDAPPPKPLAVGATSGRQGRAKALASVRSPQQGLLSDASYLAGTGYAIGSRLLQSWWRRHPLHTVVDIGEPLLQRYASRRPYQLLALSAMLGAAVVVLKPWRWNSTRRFARLSVQKEIRSFNLSSLPKIVMDTLLYNGRPPR